MKYAILILLTAANAFPAMAADDEKKDEGAPATVTVVSVKGPAQKGVTVDGKVQWTPLKAGEKLDQLTVICTGLRAEVVLKFEDRGEVTIGRCTKMGIAEFTKTQDHAKARLGLKYGTMNTSVEKGKGTSDFQIATPVATLAVRGSRSRHSFTGDMGLGLSVNQGNWNLTSGASGNSMNFGPGQNTQAGGRNISNAMMILMMHRDTGMGGVGQTRQEMLNRMLFATGRGGMFGGLRYRLPRFMRIPCGLRPSQGDHYYLSEIGR